MEGEKQEEEVEVEGKEAEEEDGEEEEGYSSISHIALTTHISMVMLAYTMNCSPS